MGEKLSVFFNNERHFLDKTLLEATISEMGKRARALKPPLPAGLYSAGAIALYESGDVEAAEAMLQTSWEDLEASGAIAVSEGPTLPDNMPDSTNEYGFYYGIEYCTTIEGMIIGFTFNEDGSAIFNQAGNMVDIPAGAIVYGDHVIDMSALDMPIFNISSDGTFIAAEGIILYVGDGAPPEGTVWLPSPEIAEEILAGDLVLSDQALNLTYGIFYQFSPLTGIKLPEGMTSISERAFYYCGIDHISIPSSITNIGSQAFKGTSIDNVFISNLDAWCKILFEDSPFRSGTVLNIKGKPVIDLIIPEGVSSINGGAFECCDTLRSVIIPNSVINIGDFAFGYNTNLEHVCLSNEIISIGMSAFRECENLKRIVLPKSVKIIGRGVFYHCWNLTIFYEGSTEPEGWDKDWNYTDIPVIWEYVGDDAGTTDTGFIWTTVKNGIVVYNYLGDDSDVTIPESINNIPVIAIGEKTFVDKNEIVTSIKIPSTISKIYSMAFGYAKITKAYIYDIAKWCSVDMVGYGNSPFPYDSGGTFYLNNEPLIDLIIPDDVINIKRAVFEYCISLNSLTISNNTTNIGDSAFYGCKNLKKVIIGNSITHIDRWAFGNCVNLTDIVFNGTMAQWNNINLDEFWNRYVPATYVQCSDGQVTL